MEDKSSTFVSKQQINKLPNIAKESGFFDTKVAELSSIKQDSNLVKEPEKKQNTEFIDSSSLNKTPITEPVSINFRSVNEMQKTNSLEPSNRSSVYTTSLTSEEPSNRSSVYTTSLTSENLIKTEGINKTNLSIAEIANKNKELMTLDQRIQQFPISQMANRPGSSVVNNYNTSGQNKGTGSAPMRSDTLSGIRNTMRAYPAWRTEMG